MRAAKSVMHAARSYRVTELAESDGSFATDLSAYFI